MSSLHAQDVRISEFLVTNTTGVQDTDGVRYGWVEIWNPSRTTKVSLASYRLTDGASTWTFPAVELPPDDRLLVWASGKNRTVTTAPLHTNFTLNPAGSTLRLLRPGGTSVASEYLNYPAQQPDISYGQDAAEPSLVGFYKTPTPEAPNNYSGSGVAGKVAFSVASGAFTSAFQVTLSEVSPRSGAEIRYTTDGTIPTSTSPLYTNPIPISTTAQVRARVFAPGLLPGEAESEAYLLLGTGMNGFTSSMPVVVLTSFGTNPITDGNSTTPDNPGYMWVWEPGTDGVTRLTNPPTLHTRVALDRRGSSTLNNPKFNLNVEARKDRWDEEKDVVLLGMPAHSDWVFSAPYEYDRSLLHNPFMYALSNAIGRYAVRTRNAEVFVDVTGGAVTFSGSSSGDYFGVYNIMEKIRRGGDRVNIKKLARYDNDAVGKTGGYIFKVDRLDAGDSGFSSPRQSSFAYYSPKETDLVTSQRDPQEQFLKSYVTAFDNAAYSTNWKNPTTGYAAYLDVGAAIDHHLLNVWSFNVDGLRLSGYLHKDRGGKIIYGPIWDFDRALYSTDGRDQNPAVWRSATGDRGTDFFNYSWWNRLFNDIDFYQAYIDRWVTLRRGGAFSPEAVNTLLDQINSTISADAINRDVARWGKAKRGWTSPFTQQSFSGQTAEVQRLKDWLQQRANFMDSQWVAPVTFSAPSSRVTPGTQVTLSGPSGATIYYTLDGSDPRPSGGAVPTGANVFTYTGTPITISATTRIKARAYNANWTARSGTDNPPLVSKWSGQTDARFSVDPPAAAGNIVVTELNYHPGDPTAAELASNPLLNDAAFEFIEIKNIGTTPVDLAGARITAGVTFAFTGESAISLAPGEYAVIAANPTAFALRYGARPNLVGPFEGDLSNGGERLVVVDEGGQTILDFTYDDVWHPLTDGGGHTLVVVDPAAEPAAFSTSANWRPSIAVGGTPGFEDVAYVTTLPASEITSTSAQLNATVLPLNAASSVTFILGGVRLEPILVPAGNSAVSVTKEVTALSPHTLHTYRAEVTNGAGVYLGDEVAFTTLNRPPLASDKTLHSNTLAPFTADAGTLASDPDGDALTITVVSQGMHGTVSSNGTSITYTPGDGYAGNDSFSYSISDGFGGTASAIVTLSNTAPVAKADLLSTEGTAVIFNPRVNDTDVDGDPLSVTSVTQGTFGTVTRNGPGLVTYTPGPQFFGNDLFSYTISDGIAESTAQVTVKGAVPIVKTTVTKGAQVPGQPDGTLYSKLGLPAGGIFAGEIRSGKFPKQRAVFAGDGKVLLNGGGEAPAIPNATIASLGEPSGQAVVATVRGSGVTRSNDTVLYAGLRDGGAVHMAAREGDEVVADVRLGSFISVDGNGETVFFLAKLTGAGVKAVNNLALCAVSEASGLRVLVRTGDLVNGEPVVGLATLVSASGTAAAGRWRVDDSAVGVRLTLPGKAQAIYTIPATAASADDWTLWMETGQAYDQLGMPRSFGLPGFAADGVAYTAQLTPGVPETVSASNDSVLLHSTADGTVVVTKEGDGVPGNDGHPLPELKFQKFADPITASGGRTAFVATLAGKGASKANRNGLWLADGNGRTRLIARAGDLAPGGGKWAAFESVVLPEEPHPTLLFTAKLAIKAADGVSAKNNRGLWGLDSMGNPRLLLRTGQPLPGGGSATAVKSFIALAPAKGSFGAARGLDGNQYSTALVTFTDGTQSLVRIWIP